jgi:hypothetical protein
MTRSPAATPVNTASRAVLRPGTRFAEGVRVLLRRCAWHRYYRGYSFVYGVARWRGIRIAFTDGVCGGCSQRLRRDLDLPPVSRPSWPTWRWGIEPLAIPPGALVLILLAVLLSLARPLDTPLPVITAALPTAPVQRDGAVGRTAVRDTVAPARAAVEHRAPPRLARAARRSEGAPAASRPLPRPALAGLVRPAAVTAADTPHVTFPQMRGADFQSP